MHLQGASPRLFSPEKAETSHDVSYTHGRAPYSGNLSVVNLLWPSVDVTVFDASELHMTSTVCHAALISVDWTGLDWTLNSSSYSQFNEEHSGRGGGHFVHCLH